ncbi:hypothetical protein [Nocardia xishanensis]|uniref:hypothetical protein n=1 Tax=Nocardia xishanensis TaxID=238964 RepID=UPI003439BF96
MSAPNRRREQAELEVEKARLDVVHGVLSDMVFAGCDAADAKGYGNDEFEVSRYREAARRAAQVHDERTAVWDRLLDYRHDAATAAQIRAEVAAAAQRSRRTRGVGRSR